MENNDKDLEIISKKLSILISLLLLNNEQLESTKEKISYLKTFGLPNIEIASILNTTKNTVEVTLTNLKKQNNKK